MGLWLNPNPLILASKSRARRAILEATGIPIDVHPANVDERGIEAASGRAAPDDVAALLARAKALATAASFPGRLTIGADQTLAVGSERFSKPIDNKAARSQLMMLRGRNHNLYSAISVARDGKVICEHVATATLTMREFSDSFLDAYIKAAGTTVSQSVGGYQLEGIGIHLFEKIEGDHFTILGLPLLPLLAFLRHEGSLA